MSNLLQLTEFNKLYFFILLFEPSRNKDIFSLCRLSKIIEYQRMKNDYFYLFHTGLLNTD
jgi:hypothetical protein